MRTLNQSEVAAVSGGVSISAAQAVVVGGVALSGGAALFTAPTMVAAATGAVVVAPAGLVFLATLGVYTASVGLVAGGSAVLDAGASLVKSVTSFFSSGSPGLAQISSANNATTYINAVDNSFGAATPSGSVSSGPLTIVDPTSI